MNYAELIPILEILEESDHQDEVVVMIGEDDTLVGRAGDVQAELETDFTDIETEVTWMGIVDDILTFQIG